jgi:hypothetical protein
MRCCEVVHPSAFIPHPWLRPRSSGVERLLGKEEVMSSNLIAGSIYSGSRKGRINEACKVVVQSFIKEATKNV